MATVKSLETREPEDEGDETVTFNLKLRKGNLVRAESSPEAVFQSTPKFSAINEITNKNFAYSALRKERQTHFFGGGGGGTLIGMPAFLLPVGGSFNGALSLPPFCCAMRF
ncbi:MAG: hypothetical protein JSS95_03885 [Acidobacteria bacterium]|nr:hypothetical protein [Acidobacteriota bacterium]